MRAITSVTFGILLAALAITGASAQATLLRVKHEGELVCGVTTGLDGSGAPDAQGHWTGFDVDFCRAIAAAIFDDPSKVRFQPVTAGDRFSLLQSGQVDVLARSVTVTMGGDTGLGLDFPVITHFDGQGFLTRRRSGVASVEDLNGASVCVQQGTTTEFNLTDYARTSSMTARAVTYHSVDETVRSYEAGGCDALTGSASWLAAIRIRAAYPDDHSILPEIISKEPLGPAVRQGDFLWSDLVRWVHHAMLNAEELGITQANALEMRRSDSPEIKRLLGAEGEFGEVMGLTRDWAYRVIRHVGNYGEVFERHLGEGSRLKINRGQNALWTRGGLQYGLPIR